MKKLLIIWKWEEYDSIRRITKHNDSYYVGKDESKKVILIKEDLDSESILSEINKHNNSSSILLMHYPKDDETGPKKRKKIDDIKEKIQDDNFINISLFQGGKDLPYAYDDHNYEIGLLDDIGYSKVFYDKTKSFPEYSVLENDKIKEVNFDSVWNYYSGIEIAKYLNTILNNLYAVKFDIDRIAELKGKNEFNKEYFNLIVEHHKSIPDINKKIIKQEISKFSSLLNESFNELYQKLNIIHETIPDVISKKISNDETDSFNDLFSEIKALIQDKPITNYLKND